MTQTNTGHLVATIVHVTLQTRAMPTVDVKTLYLGRYSQAAVPQRVCITSPDMIHTSLSKNAQGVGRVNMDINSGWMIRAARAALDLNVKDFARIAHVSTQTVTRLEGMEEFEPREDARKVRGSVLPETVAKIAAGFREVGLALDGRGERLTLTRMPEAVENYRRSQRRSAKRRK